MLDQSRMGDVARAKQAVPIGVQRTKQAETAAAAATAAATTSRIRVAAVAAQGVRRSQQRAGSSGLDREDAFKRQTIRRRHGGHTHSTHAPVTVVQHNRYITLFMDSDSDESDEDDDNAGMIINTLEEEEEEEEKEEEE